MGMDLVARNKEVESLHLNWTGWRILRGLLEGLNLDTSELSGRNNGDRVSAKMAKLMGGQLKAALEAKRISVNKVKDDQSQNGTREVFEVKLAGAELDQESHDWLYSIAEFLEKSGGFKQY